MKAIDVHGHFGSFDLMGFDVDDLVVQMKSGDIDVIRRRARAADIQLTVVSALRALKFYDGKPADTEAVLRGNEEAREAAETHPDIRFWAVLNPHIQETYRQVQTLLALPRCQGIKIHPEMHRYPIARYGLAIFEFAADHGATIQSHTGQPNSLPADFVPFANQFPGVTLLLSHLGNGDDDDYTRQVRAVQSSTAGNIYVDTSSARGVASGLLEWAVSQIGSQRILFGSDTPLYLAGCMKARVEHAEIDEDAKRTVLYDNAARLFGVGDND